MHVHVRVCVSSLLRAGMAWLPLQLIRLSESLWSNFAKTNTYKHRDTEREKYPGHFLLRRAKQNTIRTQTAKPLRQITTHAQTCKFVSLYDKLFSLTEYVVLAQVYTLTNANLLGLPLCYGGS